MIRVKDLDIGRYSFEGNLDTDGDFSISGHFKVRFYDDNQIEVFVTDFIVYNSVCTIQNADIFKIDIKDLEDQLCINGDISYWYQDFQDFYNESSN